MRGFLAATGSVIAILAIPVGIGVSSVVGFVLLVVGLSAFVTSRIMKEAS